MDPENAKKGKNKIRTEIISVTTHVPGKKPVVEFESKKFVKKSKRQKREQLRQKRRKRKRKEQAEAQGKVEKKRKIEPKQHAPKAEENLKEKTPKRKKAIQKEYDEIWEIWSGDILSKEEGAQKSYKNADKAREVAEKVIETLAKKDEMDGFQKHIIKSGTMTDRLSAWTVMFQERPIIRLSLLRRLLKWAHRKNRREKQIAIQNLTVLFTSDIMPTRALKTFQQQGYKKRITEKALLMRYFEGELKEGYQQFISALEEGTKDHMEWFRQKCIETITKLLERHAESEKLLLMLLVHKLGDRSNKVASSTLRHIQRLLKTHPAMKGVVAKEVTDYLRRAPEPRCRQKALTLLSEFEFHSTEEDKKTATLCIELYLDLFRENYIDKSKELTGKMLCSLFHGIRRAFPYAEPDLEIFEESLHSFYKLSHVGNIVTSVQALLVLRQIEEASGKISDRFYRALYSLLMRSDIVQLTKPHLLLHVLYVSIKTDSSVDRAAAFLKRLQQISVHHGSAFACGAIMLIAECFKHHKSLRELFVSSEQDEGVGLVEVRDAEAEKSKDYDPYKKEPRFANAARVPMWETCILSKHYHPNASVWTKRMVKHESITYKGDPLTNFTPNAFLKRYCYKRPKAVTQTSKFARESSKETKTVIDLYDKEHPEKASAPSDVMFTKFFIQRSQMDPDLYARREEKKIRGTDIEVDEAEADRAMFEVMEKQFGVSEKDVLGPGLDEDDWAMLEEHAALDDMAGFDFQESDSDMGEEGKDEDVFADAAEFEDLLEQGGVEDDGR